MKNKIKSTLPFILISILFLFISTFASGQNPQTQSFNDLLNLVNKGTMKRAVLSEKDIQGSPYLNDNFILGSVTSKDNIKYINVPLRYNIYNDDIEFEVSKDNYFAISNPKQMKKIEIGDDVFVYDTKRNKKGEEFGYYKLLQNGKAQLLLRYDIVFIKPTNTTGYRDAEPAKLERNSNIYYIKIGDNEPQEINNKKDIENIFQNNSKQILDFVKKEKVNLRKENELIKLVKYINESNLV